MTQQAKTLKTQFILERETKNTGRYKEVAREGFPDIIGTLYIQKWALGELLPLGLKVTIEASEEREVMDTSR